MQQTLLTRMENLINDGALNYTVFLRTYCIDSRAGQTIEDMARTVMEDDVAIDNVREVNFSEIEDDLRECLGYVGIDGAAPKAGVVESGEFQALLGSICEDAKSECELSSKLLSFRFQAGHPAYPVFWDFAFAFLGEKNCQLLVCSSSD